MRKAEMSIVKMQKINVKDMNDVLVCTLCNGYLIDATTLTECHHVFCRGCILRHFENCKAACPSCNLVYKKKNQVFFKADPQIQAIVYKVVPGLYSKEMQRREDFYRSTGVRASSSCSDDSVLERERDMINDEDSMVSSHVGEKNQFFGPEDSISLSLEYYQQDLDTSDTKKKQSVPDLENAPDKSASVLNNNNSDSVGDKHKLKDTKSDTESDKGDQRFLQCPAAVTMKHLQKFVRMKFALTQHHKVDIIYKGEVLPLHFSLMDVAYTFKWKRVKPMRFFYRIFTPMKVQPIKIKLPVVKAAEAAEPPPPSPPPPVVKEETEDKESEKERLLAHLQLQSKSKVQNNDSVPEKGQHPPPPVQDCVFDYEEPDKEEIKRFAERRDREWAMQKKMDENREKDEEYHHFSKKRKKNKHSKNDCTYKKRKLHAEITNKEEELKLKVKLTQPNGHKHRHHKSSSVEMSSKEKLLQMRQIRHKHVVSEDKNIQTVNETPSTEPIEIEKKIEVKEKPVVEAPVEVKTTTNNGAHEDPKKVDSGTKTLQNLNTKTSLSKEWGTRVATVQIERNELTEQQAKKTFLKSYQAYAEKYKNSIEKSKAECAKKPTNLELKIANLQQRCTVEAKSAPPKVENKDKKPVVEKPKAPQYPPGFTVSKIESGAKRKLETDEPQRPSLEITLINPPKAAPVPNPAKRPPPATIPLDRIKKTLNFKSGISIIPKPPENKCDNIGALDLTKPSTTKEQPKPEAKPVNGFSSKDATPKPANMSNLQMLSKLAAEQSPLNKTAKPRAQMPNLQTLRIPSPNQRIPPSLKMIDKSQFRMMSPQIRNLRPNQNQSIRNIPNPSLLVRQQQNRLNSLNPPVKDNNDKETKEIKAPPETKEISV